MSQCHMLSTSKLGRWPPVFQELACLPRWINEQGIFGSGVHLAVAQFLTLQSLSCPLPQGPKT